MAVYSVATPDVATTSTAKSVIYLKAGSTKPLRLIQWSISFEGTTATDAPSKVELLRQSSDSTVTSSTPVEWQEIGEASLATAGHTATAEGTATDVLETIFLTPNGGTWLQQYPLGREPVVGPSGRIALKVTSAANVDCRATIVFEE